MAGELTFRPLEAADLPMLHEWLARPHVAEWWDAPQSAPEHGYIALLDSQPIGFVQWYAVAGAGGGWWEDETDPGARGIDQFIADPAQLNRGLGARMVRAFVEILFRDPAVTMVQADPAPDNLRAIRSYARAWFRPVKEVRTPDGAALVMVAISDRRIWSV
ncbi:MAG: GNAT family N-acetyltransferase [Betaproteobacteria bacterium]